MLATLEEHAGQRADALATYQTLRRTFDGKAGTAGPLSDRTTEAIGRLSKPR
jgi:hypothetical protein